MAIDFSTLTGAKSVDESIIRWVNNASIPPALILNLAEQEIFKKLRVREMLALTAVKTMTADSEVVALEADYRAPRVMRYIGQWSGKIQQDTPENVIERRSYQTDNSIQVGKPAWFYTDGTNIQFDIGAREAYTFQYVYYATPAALSGGNPTNFLTTKYAPLLYDACAWQAFEFLRDDEERQRYRDKTMTQIFEANAESDGAMGWDAEVPIFAD